MNKVIHIDENDCELGIVSREEAHRTGLLHRVVIIYVFDKEGNILIQERLDGTLDHSSAGHVDPGETYLEAAERELGEELGIFGVTLEQLGILRADEILPEVGKNTKHLYAVFSCTATPGKIQEEEVKSVYFENPVAVLKKIQNDPRHQVYARGFAKSLPFLLQIKNRRT